MQMSKRGNPIFDRGNPKDKGAAGRRAEQLTARRLGAKGTPGSGALDGAKGDMTLADFLIENKTTLSESMKLELDWLLKIYGEALALGKQPALAIQFISPTAKSQKALRWICVPEAVWVELTTKE